MRTSFRVNVKRLLEFFDEAPSASKGHATSVVSVIGEDLSLALLEHCLSRQETTRSVNILRTAPSTGRRRGPRLDAWVKLTRQNGRGQLFQTEIKNWSAHAIGGQRLATDAPLDELRQFKIERWQYQRWDAIGADPLPEPIKHVAKVLVPMMAPLGIDSTRHKIEPLVIYWVALHPRGSERCFFAHSLPGGLPFRKVWIFSVSAYLRTLGRRYLNLQMPRTAERMLWLNRLFQS